MSTSPRISLDDPRRETWPYRQGLADYHRGADCPYAPGSGAASLWEAGRQEAKQAEFEADEAEEARVALYFDERGAA